MYKNSHWFNIKKTLAENGININSPLFHSTEYASAAKITQEGFKARAGGVGNDAYYDNSVCFSRSFEYLSGSTMFGGSDKIIFILDANRLKQFKQYAIDWYENKGGNLGESYSRGKNPDRYEYETRVSLTPYKPKPKEVVEDFCLRETVISPRYIEAIIYRVSYAQNIKPKLEEKLLDMANGKPLFVLYKNSIYPISKLTLIRKQLLKVNTVLKEIKETNLTKIRVREIWEFIKTLDKEHKAFVLEKLLYSRNYIPAPILLDIVKRRLLTHMTYRKLIERENIT